ncbi:MAG: SdpI family protein [Methanocellales archaeon]|nr:SdpI family protein [Methanocellales archaeon]MDD3292410.1 SdpI family protein [Methanocellales archaeon]MDD5235996.1 SdpI family protein [Methanocellales archaeon]MDD5485898.1 SdpI family protein [Methanocellales archaeon]
MRKTEKIILGILIFSFAIGIFLYPQMPERMASHWNAQGQVDDYMSKFWGLFLLPFTSVGLFLLFVLIPTIDPLKVNIEKFRDYYDGFMAFMIIFLFYIYLLTVFWNVGIRFNMTRLLAPALGILFYYCGVLIKNAKRNWFIGIRTPWTLSSEKVWDKTHQIGGKLFKIAGIIVLCGAFFPKYVLFLVFVPVISVSIYMIVYSYFEYQKEIK